MIRGIGVDLIEVERVRKAKLRWGDRFLKRIYTDAELDYCLHGALADQRLAARFAAKEAFLKALGTGLSLGARWREIEVGSDNQGAPALRLAGTAAALMSAKGDIKTHLSISHTRAKAVAFVVLEQY